MEGKDSLDWLVDRCLMRPRYIIQLVHECIGHALTNGHARVEVEDFLEGYRLYSLDIVGNTNFELRDVYPPAYDSIYCLIGTQRITNIQGIKSLLQKHGYVEKDILEIIRLLFWFGVFGAKTENGEEKYIYDFRYDEKIFYRVRQSHLGDDEPMYINLAFSAGLGCVDLL